MIFGGTFALAAAHRLQRPHCLVCSAIDTRNFERWAVRQCYSQRAEIAVLMQTPMIREQATLVLQRDRELR